MKIKISADSICDLSPELIQKYNIPIKPLHVSLGEDDFLDGITLTPEDIYKFCDETKTLPKSGACSTPEYDEFFQQILDQGYDAIVHFTISAEMSSSYSNARLSAQNFKNVYVVDSRSLSTGTGLLVLDACECVEKGMDAEQIANRAQSRVGAVRASFIVDNLEFLHKGGRCSSLTYLGANLLQIKPTLVVTDGKIVTGSKQIGRYKRCVGKYADEILRSATNPDKKRVFITHTKMDEGLAEHVVEIVKSWGIFEEVLETTAGCTVTTHCGANTIGILFINDGGLQ